MERCPVCRAKWRGTPKCRRCKSDLTPLLFLEERAEDTMRQAVQEFAKGRLKTARRLCIRADNLKKSVFGTWFIAFLDSQVTGQTKGSKGKT